MDDFVVARAIHVLSVLLWIGGVAFVTTVVMPSIRALESPEQRMRRFHEFEGRFATQVRIWVLLAGASGFWMVYRGDFWERFTQAAYWWMHAMVVLWLGFFLMLFVIEPFVLHPRMSMATPTAKGFDRMVRLHWVALAISVITVLGAVAGSHGWLF
jgi:uncharacterized membrane protein